MVFVYTFRSSGDSKGFRDWRKPGLLEISVEIYKSESPYVCVGERGPSAASAETDNAGES
jgi:hypothetical protein